MQFLQPQVSFPLSDWCHQKANNRRQKKTHSYPEYNTDIYGFELCWNFVIIKRKGERAPYETEVTIFSKYQLMLVWSLPFFNCAYFFINPPLSLSSHKPASETCLHFLAKVTLTLSVMVTLWESQKGLGKQQKCWFTILSYCILGYWKMVMVSI